MLSAQDCAAAAGGTRGSPALASKLGTSVALWSRYAADMLTRSPSFNAPSALVKTALFLLSAAPCACPCNLDVAVPKKAGLFSAEQL